MARVRQARPCSARRTNGEPCRNFAMNHSTICHAHGGRAAQVRRRADQRALQAAVERSVEHDLARHRERLAAWQHVRIVAAAELLGMEPAEVAAKPALLGMASARWPRRVPPADQAPKLRHDRRYGSRCAGDDHGRRLDLR